MCIRDSPDITYCSTAYEAMQNADAVIIMTEWDEFKKIDWQHAAQLVRNKIIVDTRNIININALKKMGFVCDTIGQSYLCVT